VQCEIGTLGAALETDFIRAVWRGDLSYVKSRLDAGVSANTSVDVAGSPALIEALRSQHFDVARLLVERSADVNLAGPVHKSPLHYTAGNGVVALTRLLIDRGANLEAQDTSGKTALHVAAECGHVKMCELLLDSGACIDAVAHNRMVPLHYAAWHGQCEVIRLLVGRGAGINDIFMSESTPLHLAAWYGEVEACRTLCDLGASPSYSPHWVSSNYVTPFQNAISGGKESVIRFFMFEHGEDLAQKTLDGRTMATLAKHHAGLYKRLREVQKAVRTSGLIDAKVVPSGSTDAPRSSRTLSPL
jgi:ankyrin repeat protein